MTYVPFEPSLSVRTPLCLNLNSEERITFSIYDQDIKEKETYMIIHLPIGLTGIIKQAFERVQQTFHRAVSLIVIVFYT